MRRYLQHQQCRRTSLGEHLDAPGHWRWCMGHDVPCDVCQTSHEEPIGPPPTTGPNASQTSHTGVDAIHRARLEEQTELSRYVEDLAAVRGSCLLCRATGQQWDHAFFACDRRFKVFRKRDEIRNRHKARGRAWLQPFAACFWCWNPQSVCPRADRDGNNGIGKCKNGDVVLPLCYGVYERAGGRGWLHERFGREFESMDSYMDWLGEGSNFGGRKAIQAVRAKALRDYQLY